MSKHTPGPWEQTDRTVYSLEHYGWRKGVEQFRNRFSCTMSHDGSGVDPTELLANARLIAAAPDLLEAQTMGAEVNTPDFLDWIADRLINSYGVNPNVDFVHSLRERAKAGRAAIAKATGP